MGLERWDPKNATNALPNFFQNSVLNKLENWIHILINSVRNVDKIETTVIRPHPIPPSFTSMAKIDEYYFVTVNPISSNVEMRWKRFSPIAWRLLTNDI